MVSFTGEYIKSPVVTASDGSLLPPCLIYGLKAVVWSVLAGAVGAHEMVLLPRCSLQPWEVAGAAQLLCPCSDPHCLWCDTSLPESKGGSWSC